MAVPEPVVHLTRPTTKHPIKKFRTEIAASSASVLSTIVTYPLDNIKTRQQGERDKKIPLNIKQIFRNVYEQERLRGFWRGLVPPLISLTVVRTFQFSIYQRCKYKISEIMGRSGAEEPLVTVNNLGSVPTLGTITCFGASGFVAGAFAALVASPLEIIKNAQVLSRKMAGGSLNKTFDPKVCSSYLGLNTLQTGKMIVRNFGVMGLYAGFRHQFVKESVGNAVFFATYESTKQLMTKYQGATSATSPEAVAFAGGLCGVIGLLTTYPLDSARTDYQMHRLAQRQTRTVPGTALAFFKARSWNGFPVAAARSAISTMIFFSVFESVKKGINKIPEPAREGRSIE